MYLHRLTLNTSIELHYICTRLLTVFLYIDTEYTLVSYLDSYRKHSFPCSHVSRCVASRVTLTLEVGGVTRVTCIRFHFFPQNETVVGLRFKWQTTPSLSYSCYNRLIACSFRSKRILPPLRGSSYVLFPCGDMPLTILQILCGYILPIWSFQYLLLNTRVETGCMSHCSNVFPYILSLCCNHEIKYFTKLSNSNHKRSLMPTLATKNR